MIITACLAFHAEPPEFLDRCVRSLAPFCDRLVALGGRWDLFPTGGDKSAELKAIRSAAAQEEIQLLLWWESPFKSQVAKRDQLMKLASDHSDWLIVIDGDEHLETLDADAAAARAALEETRFDVAEVLLRPMNKGWPLREMPANEVPVRRIYRTGVRCPGPAHNVYELDGRYLNGDPNRMRLEPTLDLSSLLVLNHDNQNRGQERDDAAKQYRRARGQARTEAWA